jgi:hypothetical protein
MAELGEAASRRNAPDLPDRITLRFWPWLVLCVVGIAAFAGLGFIAFYIASGRASTVSRVIAVLIGLGLAALIVYLLASLRTRTVLDREGGTAISAFRRERLRWSDVDRIDAVHILPGWAVRAWQGDAHMILFMCHDTHGRRPTAATFDTPPHDSPRALIDGYALAIRYWRAARL